MDSKAQGRPSVNPLYAPALAALQELRRLASDDPRTTRAIVDLRNALEDQKRRTRQGWEAVWRDLNAAPPPSYPPDLCSCWQRGGYDEWCLVHGEQEKEEKGKYGCDG